MTCPRCGNSGWYIARGECGRLIRTECPCGAAERNRRELVRDGAIVKVNGEDERRVKG